MIMEQQVLHARIHELSHRLARATGAQAVALNEELCAAYTALDVVQ